MRLFCVALLLAVAAAAQAPAAPLVPAAGAHYRQDFELRTLPTIYTNPLVN